MQIIRKINGKTIEKGVRQGEFRITNAHALDIISAAIERIERTDRTEKL